VEVSAGLYVGAYTVQVGDEARELPVLVRLTDAFGLSSQSRLKDVTLSIDASPPPPPEDVVARKASGQGIVVTWKAGPDAAGFVLYRSCPEDSELVELARLPRAQSYTDALLEPPSQPCTYQVSAFDEAKNLSYPAVARWMETKP
jgi:hypothetical protein